MRKKALIGISIFVLLMGLFAMGLNKNPHELPSVLIGKPLPLQHEALPQKTFYLVNIWGTWCTACHQEHPFLLELAKEINIVGINWAADNVNEKIDAENFLKQKGNPYQINIFDNGKIITNLGVYGAPETFLISPNQEIIFRYAGLLTEEIWQQKIKPLMDVSL